MLIRIKILCWVCSTGSTLRCFYKYIIFHTLCLSFQDFSHVVMLLRIDVPVQQIKCVLCYASALFLAAALLSTSSDNSRQEVTLFLHSAYGQGKVKVHISIIRFFFTPHFRARLHSSQGAGSGVCTIADTLGSPFWISKSLARALIPHVDLDGYLLWSRSRCLEHWTWNLSDRKLRGRGTDSRDEGKNVMQPTAGNLQANIASVTV